MSVLVCERRSVLGGAAITEELFAGFKYSRASYLAGLLRPKVIKELDLMRSPSFPKGIKYYQRDPSSFTPTLMSGFGVVLDDDFGWLKT